MSTSRREDVARQFIAGAEVGVIFKINTASTSYNVLHPFGDISHFSSKPSEEEILFFAGAVLRLDSVEEENGSTWMIKLTLHNEKVEQMEQLMDGIGTQLTYITHWEHLFMKTDDLILFLNILIGYNYSHLSKYNDALFHYDIALSSVDENNKLAGELYIHLGDVCKATNNFQSALSYYEKALRVLTSHDVNDRDIARIYRKVSDIHLNQNNYEDAIIYEEQADEIDQRHAQRSELNIDTSLKYFQNHLDTSSDHPEIRRARSLYSIGLCLMKKSDYHQALDKFLEAKVLFETHLTLTNNSARTFIPLYDSLALVYLLLNDKFNTLIMLKRSIDIRISYPSEIFKTSF
jgi:tetratricopeptide (TPR) repeat protein